MGLPRISIQNLIFALNNKTLRFGLSLTHKSKVIPKLLSSELNVECNINNKVYYAFYYATLEGSLSEAISTCAFFSCTSLWSDVSTKCTIFGLLRAPASHSISRCGAAYKSVLQRAEEAPRGYGEVSPQVAHGPPPIRLFSLISCVTKLVLLLLCICDCSSDSEGVFFVFVFLVIWDQFTGPEVISLF